MRQVRHRPRYRRGAILLLCLLALLANLAAALRWGLLDAAPQYRPSATVPALQAMLPWWRWQDPRRLPDGARTVLRLSAGELQLLADQATRLLGGASQLKLSPGQLQIQTSVPVWGRWANVELLLLDGDTLPVIDRLQLGGLAWPRWVITPLLQAALAIADRPQGGTPPLHQMVQGVRFQTDSARIHYRWRADLPARLSHWLVPPAQLARMQVYQAALVSAVRAERGAQELPALLMPLFHLARERSLAGGEAAAENRAALLVLAAHLGGRPLASWLPQAKAWPPVPRWPVLLAGRNDFPVHLLVSAALAAEGGGPLADALGLAKELGDARHGSGFSFNDYAINRAGSRLGELAVQDPLRLQLLLSAGVTTQTLLPDVSDLPEFLPESEFKSRFGGVGSPAYDAMTARIEARVAAMRLWQH